MSAWTQVQIAQLVPILGQTSSGLTKPGLIFTSNHLFGKTGKIRNYILLNLVSDYASTEVWMTWQKANIDGDDPQLPIISQVKKMGWFIHLYVKGRPTIVCSGVGDSDKDVERNKLLFIREKKDNNKKIKNKQFLEIIVCVYSNSSLGNFIVICPKKSFASAQFVCLFLLFWKFKIIIYNF